MPFKRSLFQYQYFRELGFVKLLDEEFLLCCAKLGFQFPFSPHRFRPRLELLIVTQYKRSSPMCRLHIARIVSSESLYEIICLPCVECSLRLACENVNIESHSYTLHSKNFCGAEGDRTPDLVNAIHALSQLSYSPNELKTIYEDALLKSTNDRENL